MENIKRPGARQVRAVATRESRFGAKLAMFEQESNDGGREAEGYSGGNEVREAQVTQALAESLPELWIFLVRGKAGQCRQQVSSEGDAEHPLRQFHQAHGVVERRDDAGIEPKRKRVGGENVNLERCDADRTRQHFADDFAHRRIFPRRIQR